MAALGGGEALDCIAESGAGHGGVMGVEEREECLEVALADFA